MRKNKIISRTLVGALLLFAVNSYAETKESCTHKHEEWIQKYGASSPVEAFNKSSPHQIGKDRFLDSIQNPTSVYVDSHEVQNRFIGMRREVESIIRGRDPSELVIVFMGGAHLLDFYLSQYPNFEIRPTYAHIITNEKVPVFSKNLRDFLAKYCNDDFRCEREILGTKTFLRVPGLEDYNQKKFPLDFDYLLKEFKIFSEWFHFSQIQKMDLIDQLFSGSTQTMNKSVLLVGDLHSLDSASILEELPNPECLRLLGYKKIKIAVEGFSQSVRLEGPELNDSLSHYNYYGTTRCLTSFQEMWARYFYSDFFEEFKCAEICTHPNLLALSTYGLNAEKNGIPVEYFGIEPDPDRTDIYYSTPPVERTFQGFLKKYSPLGLLGIACGAGYFLGSGALH